MSGSKSVEQQKGEERHVPTGEGGNGTGGSEERQALAVPDAERALTVDLIEVVCGRGNLNRAYKRVKANKGAPGVDGMKVEDLREWLRTHKDEVIGTLLAGSYRPQPVRGVEIPKPGGGVRQLGIPTVVDRLVQQAILQVLEPILEPQFSDSSFGFRPGRSAHNALRIASEYVGEGRTIVVDMDLEKFFDRVNHDTLMARVARKVRDKRVLRIIRRFLEAGMMTGGLVSQRTEGTPQGGPLSPLLSNVLLDDLDKELERRGHSFCRYADDCNIYVRTRRSGERVMESVTVFLEKWLKLKVNREKSAVDRPWNRKFLGYSLTMEREPRLKVAPSSVERLKGNLKVLFRKGRGRNLRGFIREDLTPVLRGWVNYFRLAGVRGIFEELDQWIRCRLRANLWRQWKRSYTRAKWLMQLGLSEVQAWRSATNGRGPWWNAGASHMNQALPKRYFDACGLASLLDQHGRFQFTTRTAVYGTVRTVV